MGCLVIGGWVATQQSHFLLIYMKIYGKKTGKIRHIPSRFPNTVATQQTVPLTHRFGGPIFSSFCGWPTSSTRMSSVLRVLSSPGPYLLGIRSKTWGHFEVWNLIEHHVTHVGHVIFLDPYPSWRNLDFCLNHPKYLVHLPHTKNDRNSMTTARATPTRMWKASNQRSNTLRSRTNLSGIATVPGKFWMQKRKRSWTNSWTWGFRQQKWKELHIMFKKKRTVSTLC